MKDRMFFYSHVPAPVFMLSYSQSHAKYQTIVYYSVRPVVGVKQNIKVKSKVVKLVYSPNCFVNYSTVWLYSKIILLVELYREHRDDFKNPVLKKREVWSRISNGMKEKGYTVAGELCDKKIRQLKTGFVFRYSYWELCDKKIRQLKTGFVFRYSYLLIINQQYI